MTHTLRKTFLWALLIGINDYPDDETSSRIGKKQELKGCVNDLKLVHDYLAMSNHVDINMLTAPAPADRGPTLSSDEVKNWPSYSNVTSGLEKIHSCGQRGDHALFYFAGHGCRPGDSADEKLALVLRELDDKTDPNAEATSHVYGKELAFWFKRMVNKGIVLTVVLDCCFSGSVFRDSAIRGTNTRGINLNTTYSSTARQQSSRSYEWTLRDGLMSEDGWIIRPDGYAMLTACEPHGQAEELLVTSLGQYRGALTHYLFEALGTLNNRMPGDETLSTVYEQLCIHFQANRPSQVPMLYGRTDFPILGGLGLGAKKLRHTLVYWEASPCDKDRPSCRLYAGQAHGVHPDDKYSLKPPPVMDIHNEQTDAASSVLARVETTSALTSKLILDPSDLKVQNGWVATPLTTQPRRDLHVAIPPTVLASLGLARSAPMTKWLKMLPRDRDVPFDFHVIVNALEEYVILGEKLQELHTVPKLLVTAPNSVQSLMDMLQHLASFQYIKNIDNNLEHSAFEKMFSISVDASRKDHPSRGVYTVNHGGTWFLNVTNLSGDRDSGGTLYVTILDMTPSWAVSNFLANTGQGHFIVIEPGQTVVQRITMGVSPALLQKGITSCEEVFKVLITSRPTQFHSVLLPRLADVAGVEETLAAHPARGGHSVAEFFNDLFGGFRAQQLYPREAWASRNLIIRTVVE